MTYNNKILNFGLNLMPIKDCFQIMILNSFYFKISTLCNSSIIFHKIIRSIIPFIYKIRVIINCIARMHEDEKN